MTGAVSPIAKLGSTTKFSVIVVTIAIITRAIQQLFYLDVMFDPVFQAVATRNMLHGHGITLDFVFPQNLSAICFDPLINWPPGYSLLIAPVYFITNGNYLLTLYLFNLFGAILIIIFCRKLLILLQVSLSWVNAFTLISSFFIYYFYFIGSPDSITVGFFLAAIYFCSKSARNPQITMYSLITGILLLLCASLKYLFFPVVFIIPLWQFIIGFKTRSNQIIRNSVITFLIPLAGIMAIYFYQKSISGTGTYISEPGRGIYLSQLLKVHPAIPGAFITQNTLSYLKGKEYIHIILQAIHILLLIVVGYFASKYIFKPRKPHESFHRLFLVLVGLVILIVQGELALLSLFIKSEIFTGGREWTYIEDARYYGIVEILIQLTVVFLFWNRRHFFRKSFNWTIALAVLILPETARGLLFTSNRIVRFGREDYYWKKELRLQNTIARVIKSKKTEWANADIVVSSPDYYQAVCTGRDQNAPVLRDWQALNNLVSLRANHTTIVLVVIDQIQINQLNKFIQTPGVKLSERFENYFIYSVLVKP